MSPKKYLFDVDGEISKVLSQTSAEIEFMLDGKTEAALLKQERFYYNGRLILELSDCPLAYYIREGMQVQFSCHTLEQHDGGGNPFHSIHCKWYAMMCWTKRARMTKVSTRNGLFGTVGTIVELSKRRGVLSVLDGRGDEYRASFHASRVYQNGKKFPGSKALNAQFCLHETMFLDAVPQLAEENGWNCKWLAVCAFQGPRPRLPNLFDMSTNDSQIGHAAQKPNASGIEKDCGSNDRVDQFQRSHTNCAQLCKVIKMRTNNPRTIFTTGYGFILDTINNEFGVILGCFRKNVFQTILFHRSNAFLFKASLARAKLSEIFMEGDRVKFIAVGAPRNFCTDWIAAQVSVSVDDDEDSSEE